jgi:hypothetical protein
MIRKICHTASFFALIINFDSFKLQPFGIGVHRIHDTGAAQRQGTDVKVMSRCDRPADQCLIYENGHKKVTSGP